MLKNYRKFLTAGVLAFGLAACGDDVTITEPAPPPPPPETPNIVSFSVAPGTATVGVGQSLQAAANLITKAGVAGAVTWTSATPAVATVSASGLITAVAAGTTLIEATATAGGQTAKAQIGVTVVTQLNILSFTISPTTTDLKVGEVRQTSVALQTRQGVSGTVAYTSLTPSVASVDASGKITAVSAGAATIVATATAGGQTATASVGVTVTAATPAQISIQSVTQFANTVPVPLNNVQGQIEINMNFDPGDAVVDSVNVFIGAKRAAKQAFATSPAAGIISLSVNTANFVKNSTTGVATVDFQNGASTISAAVYPRGGAATATNTIAIVLNNTDGWAADMSAPANFANNAGGLTFWGGPATSGLTTATVYPVIYTPGRSIQTVSFNVGGCSNFVDTSLPFRATFGSNAGATSACTYQYTGGTRDNVAVASAIDNTNNPFPTTPLIANVTVPGSTPDSLRFDWGSPNIGSLPSVVGAHGFNWVNDAWTFAGASATDAGVGMPASPVYNRFRTGTSTPAITTGADFAETNTNNATDGHRVYFTTTDRLGNMATSGNTGYFGVDRTAPSIRYASVATLPNVRTYALPADTVTVINAPAAATPQTLWAVEAIDNRAGLFDTPASGATRGVVQSVKRLAPGAIGTTVSVAGDNNYTAVALVDGWRQTVAIPVWGSAALQANNTPGYYTYTATIRDRAGNTVDLTNAAGAVAQRRYAIDPDAPISTGIGMPATFGTDKLNLAGTFTIAAQDDLEVIGTRIRIDYNAGIPFVFPASVFTNVGVRYDGTLAGAIATAQNLTTPVVSPVTTPDFWAGWQALCNGACTDTDPGVDGLGEPNAGIAGTPLSAGVQVTDVFGTTSAWLDAAILPASVPTATALPVNTYTGGNVINTGIQVRFQSGTTVRQVSPFSVTLPQLARLHAFRLIAGELVYQGTVQGSAGVGSDNGLERFWDYNFGAALTPAGTYAIVAMYNGPVAAAQGTALVYIFTK